MTTNRLFRSPLFLLGVVAAAGLVSGAVFARWNNDSGPALAHDGLGDEPPDERLQVVQELGEDHAFAMLWTSDADLWFVTSQADGRLVLNHHSTSTGSAESWDVPVAASQTTYTLMAVDSRGRIWIAANYAVAAFDPDSSAFAFEQVLDKFPAELDPEAKGAMPFEGSWVAGMVADSAGHVYLVRQSTKALFRVTTEGVEVAEVTDESPTTVRVVEGRARPMVQENDYLREADAEGQEPFFSVAPSTCELNYRAPGEGAQLVANGEPYSQGLLLAHTDPVVVDASANRVALGVGFAGVVVRADCGTGEIEAISLGSTQEFMDGLYGGPDVSKPITNRNVAFAVALSPGGKLAVSTSSHSVMLIDE